MDNQRLDALTTRVERLEQIVQETLNSLRVNESLSTIRSLTQLEQALHLTSESIGGIVKKARMELIHKELDFNVEEASDDEINELTIEARCGDEGNWTFCNATDREPIEHDALARYCLARYGNEATDRLIYLNVFTVTEDE